MFNKLSQLSFIIGLFFTITAIILFINVLVNQEQGNMGKYTSIVFLIFGVFMMLLKEEREE